MCYQSALRLSNNSDMTIEGKALLLLLLLLLLAFRVSTGFLAAPEAGMGGGRLGGLPVRERRDRNVLAACTVEATPSQLRV